MGVHRLALMRPEEVPFRTNVRGIEVPVVLGHALAGGAFAGLAVLIVIAAQVGALPSDTLAVGIALIVMWAAGAWDDRRGDERPRGFRGHLSALGSRTMTGGLVKIAAALVAGLAVAPFVPSNGAAPSTHVFGTVALVALSANLVNLFDRAPGRAGKVALLGIIPLLIVGDRGWALSMAPVLGALLLCMPLDLRERGMLGDAGANPLGAVIGVGLAASLGEWGRSAAIIILLVLNLVSEKWSFSRAIEATPPLRWIDGLGRKDDVASKSS